MSKKLGQDVTTAFTMHANETSQLHVDKFIVVKTAELRPLSNDLGNTLAVPQTLHSIFFISHIYVLYP